MFTSRHLVSCCLTVITLILTACQPAIAWSTFTSTKGNFSILMPQTPQESQKTVDMGILSKIGIFTFAVEDPSGEFIVAYADYPADIISKINPYAILDAQASAAASYMAREVKFKVTSTKNINWKNRFPGREIRLESVNGDVNALGRIYLVNARSYVILGTMSVATFTGSQIDEITKYLDSFDLLKS
jgi:hypothetical protein